VAGHSVAHSIATEQVYLPRSGAHPFKGSTFFWSSAYRRNLMT
jgi:hypothetical protein